MYRQGDVLLVPVSAVPRGARAMGHCVVAEGEVTGHSHRIEAGATQYVTEKGERYVVVSQASALLKHEEHGWIDLPGPAVYRVVYQEEYAPGTAQKPLWDVNGARRAADELAQRRRVKD